MGFIFKKAEVLDPIGNSPLEHAVELKARELGELFAHLIASAGSPLKAHDLISIRGELESAILRTKEWQQLETSEEEVCVDEGSYTREGLNALDKKLQSLTGQSLSALKAPSLTEELLD